MALSFCQLKAPLPQFSGHCYPPPPPAVRSPVPPPSLASLFTYFPRRQLHTAFFPMAHPPLKLSLFPLIAEFLGVPVTAPLVSHIRQLDFCSICTGVPLACGFPRGTTCRHVTSVVVTVLLACSFGLARQGVLVPLSSFPANGDLRLSNKLRRPRPLTPFSKGRCIPSFPFPSVLRQTPLCVLPGDLGHTSFSDFPMTHKV